MNHVRSHIEGFDIFHLLDDVLADNFSVAHRARDHYGYYDRSFPDNYCDLEPRLG